MSASRRDFLIAGATGAGGLLLASSVLGCAGSALEPRRFYLPRHRTIAHEIIYIQSRHESSNPTDEYMLLDMLLEVAAKKVERSRSLATNERDEALYSLQKIDEVLRTCGFTYESVRLLGSGLRKRELNCDGLSAFYISLGEVLDLPIRMVRAPAHTFVRWHLSEADYINWETTAGDIRSDEYFVRELKIAPETIGPTALRSLDVRSNRLAILANAYVNDGVQWLSENDVDEAIGSFKEAASRDLHYETPRYNLGLAYFSKGMLDQSILWCEQVVDLNPDHVKAHAVLAQAYGKQGRAARSRLHRLRVFELDPGYYT